MIIYFDLDGVLADFDTGISRLTGVKYDSRRGNWFKISDEHWRMVLEDKDFWINLPVMPNAPSLFNNIRLVAAKNSASIKFLTSSGGDPKAVHQKAAWVHDNFFGRYNDVIVVPNRKEKIKYAGKDMVLIDDHKGTIDNWNKAGGIGIYYRDPIREIEGI